MSQITKISNVPDDAKFVTILSGFHIYKLTDGSFLAVKRTTNMSRKIVDSFTASTLIETATRALNGQKPVSNQLQNLRQAVQNFAQNELAGYFNFARSM